MDMEEMSMDAMEVSIKIEDSIAYNNFAWNHNNTLLFLNEFKKRFMEFKDPKRKKKDIWEKIAVEMRINGYDVTSSMLDKKLRNMKATFRIILDNSNKKSTGKCPVKWKYFDIFQDIFQNRTVTSTATTIISQNTICEKMEDIIKPENLSEIDSSSTIPSTSTGFVWGYENTLLFLEKFKAKYDEFKDPNKRKKDVWEAISSEMREVNYEVTSDMLDRKFRNMKITYRTILDNNNKKPGPNRTKWEFFNIFHEIFQNDCMDETGNTEIILQMPDSNLTFCTSPTSSTFVWSHKNTLMFLEEFKSRFEQFKDPKIKKKDLWEGIAKDMRQKGYDVSSDMLDRKFRNMKITFRTILENNNKKSTGRGRIKWKYFNIFQDIFQNDRKRIFEKRFEENRKLLRLEEMKLEELKKLREAIEESNKISLERIRLLKENLKHM